MIVGKDREETIRLTAEALGCSYMTAAEIVAIELGGPGDVIDLDDDKAETDSAEEPPPEG